MNRLFLRPLLCTLAISAATVSTPAAVSPEKAAATVILDETGVNNLKIATVEAEETVFEQTAFALGRIQPIPEHRAVVSSRIPGRIIEIKSILGTVVQAGTEVLRLESRQPGDPPPSIWLKAPAGGLVTKSDTRLGEPVDPDKVLMEITDLSQVHAVARVPEHLAGRIQPGCTAHIRVSALPNESFEGTLLRFATSADRATGTIDALFALANPTLSLRPDMRAEFSIVLGRRENVTSIPRSALQGDASSRFVYVKDYELPFAFVKVPVQTGAINDRFVEITSGLLAGDEVVTTGAYSLAFAGRGSVSLKAALDAAHGHEHNEDGSEVTAGQKTASTATAQSTTTPSLLTLLSLASNALLLALLIASKRSAQLTPTHTPHFSEPEIR